jgi:hypothetical protein
MLHAQFRWKRPFLAMLSFLLGALPLIRSFICLHSRVGADRHHSCRQSALQLVWRNPHTVMDSCAHLRWIAPHFVNPLLTTREGPSENDLLHVLARLMFQIVKG